MITRRKFLKSAAAIGTSGLVGNRHRAWQRTRPTNILFLLADDLRFDAVGYINKNVRTPNIDCVAKDAVRFLNMFVTTSICCTSRASIFTGTYARRHGVWDFNTPLPPSLLLKSYPAILRNAGYRTGFFGKYGVGDYKKGAIPGTTPHVPKEDEANFDVIEDFDLYYDQNDVDRRHHHNELMAQKAEQFIRSSSHTSPFCLSLSFRAPHASDVQDLIAGPYPAEPDLSDLYARDIFTEGPTANEAAYEIQPDYIRASLSRLNWLERFSTPWLWQDSVRKYYALVTGIDRAIGRILKVLEERDVLDTTVIIFTSDNGYFLGDYGLSDKWYGYEASIRVPLTIRPVNNFKPQDVRETVLNIDLAPTILAFAGIPIPATMQGSDLSSLWMHSHTRKRWRTDFLYEHYLSGLQSPSANIEALIPSSEGVRDERYTYLRYPRQAGENEQLFDRDTDANELKNIIRTAPLELVERLRNRTDALIVENA